MPIRDPVLLALLGSAVATFFYLVDRRRRERRTALDRFASRHGMTCERDPPLSSFAPLEPLGLLPPVVAVERMVTGVLRAGPLASSTSLWAVLCGDRRRARPALLGVFAAPPELPTARILPAGAEGLREDLGYAAMPAEGLPPGYEAQAFQPLSRRLTLAVGAELARVPGFRVELRPGRLLLAAADQRPERIEQMMELGLRLLRAAAAALTKEEAPAASEASGSAPPAGPALPVSGSGGGLLN